MQHHQNPSSHRLDDGIQVMGKGIRHRNHSIGWQRLLPGLPNPTLFLNPTVFILNGLLLYLLIPFFSPKKSHTTQQYCSHLPLTHTSSLLFFHSKLNVATSTTLSSYISDILLLTWPRVINLLGPEVLEPLQLQEEVMLRMSTLPINLHHLEGLTLVLAGRTFKEG